MFSSKIGDKFNLGGKYKLKLKKNRSNPLYINEIKKTKKLEKLYFPNNNPNAILRGSPNERRWNFIKKTEIIIKILQ